jgi:hypothetical protein
MTKKWYKDPYIILQIAILLVLSGIILFRLEQFDMPASTTDELGYLSFPAQVVGLNWKDLMQYTDFYGKGYGMLLIPLYALLYKVPWVIYKLAICLNLLFLILSFYSSLYCAKKLFPKWNKMMRLACCFILTLYPTNLFYSHIALPEVLLYLLFWLTILCLINYSEKRHFKWLVIFIFILGYMYLVHLRTIGILLASVITIVFLLLRKEISLKQIAIIIGLFIGIVIIIKLFQYFHYEYIGGQNELNVANVSVTKANSIIMIIIESISNLGAYTMAILGRMYYLLVTGNIIFLLGISYLFKNVYNIIKETIKGEHQQEYVEVYIFLVLAFGITLLGSATGGIHIRRMDIPVYGRYIENTIGPILLCGGYVLTTIEKFLKRITIAYTAAILCLGPIVYMLMQRAEEKYFISDSAVGLGGFFYRNMQGKDFGASLILASIVAIAISLIICFINVIKLKGMLTSIVLISVIGLYWLSLGKSSEKEFFEVRQNLQYKYIDIIFSVLDSDKSAEIIYIRGKEPYCVAAKYVQFLVSDRKITVINKEDVDVEVLEKKDFVMVYDSYEINENLLDKYNMVVETNDLCVYQAK